MTKNGIELGIFKQAETCYFQGDYKEARKICMDAIKDGNIYCIRLLGWMYFRGHGCKKNINKAMEYFRMALEKGDVESEFGIAGIFYEQEDYKEAFAHFSRSAENGYVPAKHWLGILYNLGLGTKQDFNKARKLYREAAKLGNMPAYCAYSIMLLRGGEGFYKRLIAIPMLLKFFIVTIYIRLKDEHSERLM